MGDLSDLATGLIMGGLVGAVTVGFGIESYKHFTQITPDIYNGVGFAVLSGIGALADCYIFKKTLLD